METIECSKCLRSFYNDFEYDTGDSGNWLCNFCLQKMKTDEWWSDCCTAPPLYELHDLDNKEIPDVIGICMCCREHTSFQCCKEEE